MRYQAGLISVLIATGCNKGGPLGPCEQKFERAAYVYNHTGLPIDLDVIFSHTRDDGRPMPTKITLAENGDRQRTVVDQGAIEVHPPGKFIPTEKAKCHSQANQEISLFSPAPESFEKYTLCEGPDRLRAVYSGEEFLMSSDVLHVYPKDLERCPPGQRPALRPQ